MNITFFIGLLMGFGAVIGGFLLEKGTLMSLLKLAPACIIFGGTFAIALVQFPMSSIKMMPAALKLIIFNKKHNYTELIDKLCEIANKARKDGLLSLETEAEQVSDPFIKRGLGYIADGVDPDFLKKLLYNEIEAMENKYELAAAVFEGMGGTAPTLGVLGTVLSMVTVLSNAGDNSNAMVKEIAGAFIATMYGLGSANLLWLPIGGRIKNVTQGESAYMELIVEGLMAIQAGEPSSRLRDRLVAKLDDQKISKKSGAKKKGEAEE
ncbi:MAG: MotA/TolQ/ExbB proton channel family protein [Clostridia bacterium]|nr:MotA/TolQ/ExbB proton channel family protein [Clostridia bacterium]MDR3644648.1 MotA/TolQ/ExbB proton channel family protein [Clostridia bacterium]